MRSPAFSKIRALLVVFVAAAGLNVVAPAASAAAVSIDLCAEAGTLPLPGPSTVDIWGFGIATTPGDCSTATAQLPGPVLAVDEGDTVTINVTNGLPGTRTLTFEVPGVEFNPGPADAAAGATVTRTFTASDPGSYLYQSGGDAGRQEAMGLYGALIVRSATPNQAYDNAASAYNVQSTLVLSALDPAFNAAPDTFNMRNYLATYWLINGSAYPDTAPGITAAAGQRILLRYLNGGYDNTTMLLLGMHEQVLARDARLLTNPFDAVAETIPAGATEDVIAVMPSTAPPTTNGFPLYNRQLHLTNGPQSGATPPVGGALTFIHP